MAYFQTKNPNGAILKGLAMEDVGIPILWAFGLFLSLLVYVTTIWSILRTFRIFCNLVYFFSTW
jgi:hypothetical protein